jgi:hypothetical protein
MRLFFEGHNCWLERRSFGNNLSEGQIKEFIIAEILNYSNHIRNVAAAQGDAHCFYFPEFASAEGSNIVRTFGETEDFVRSQSDSWRTINSYHRVRYSLGHDNCCGYCGGTGINPALIMSHCAYCDGTKVQLRHAIPENFMCKPIEEHSHDKKKYGKWVEHYNSLRNALDECSVID